MHELERNLRLTGLYDLFAPHVYSGEQVEHGKPAPDLFLLAADRLGVGPEKCLVIEDSVNGVRAGRAAGMTVWGFVGGGHCSNQTGHLLKNAGAHQVVGDYGEALRLFRIR